MTILHLSIIKFLYSGYCCSCNRFIAENYLNISFAIGHLLLLMQLYSHMGMVGWVGLLFYNPVARLFMHSKHFCEQTNSFWWSLSLYSLSQHAGIILWNPNGILSKAQRCDSYLKIWNYESLTDPLTGVNMSTVHWSQ